MQPSDPFPTGKRVLCRFPWRGGESVERPTTRRRHPRSCQGRHPWPHGAGHGDEEQEKGIKEISNGKVGRSGLF